LKAGSCTEVMLQAVPDDGERVEGPAGIGIRTWRTWVAVSSTPSGTDSVRDF